MSSYLDEILNIGFISRIRRNHGLEHATLHIMAKQFPARLLFGQSDPWGFHIIGDVPDEAVQTAAEEGLQRMRNGEHNLAVHPNCGTNFVTSGILAGGAAALAMLMSGPRKRDKLEGLAVAVLVATLALILSQPLGLLLQAKLTTSGDPGPLKVDKITSKRRGTLVIHRILTRG
jgi:hypothetical protein